MSIQIKSRQLSALRQKLTQFPDISRQAFSPFLGSSPMTRGTLYRLRRKCSKPNCRCARGELHSSLVLTASVCGKTKLWTVSGEQAERLRESTEEYRRFHRARSRFLKDWARRKNEILRVIDAIGGIRTPKADAQRRCL
ncbi:MAG: DUF6788 family protein [Elusimicrobiota bacterium]